MGINSQGDGSQDVPKSALCKAERQEIWWNDSVWVQKPGNQGSQWVNTLPDTLRKNVLPVIWAFLSPVKTAHN